MRKGTKKTIRKTSRKEPGNPIFMEACRQMLGVEVKAEYRFHPVRKWRFDYALPEYKIALEVEGGVWIGGRHTSSQGFIKDMEKYNTAALMGWRVLRCLPKELNTMRTIDMIRDCMNNRTTDINT